MPSNLTAREVLCWVDAVIGYPMKYTASRLGVSQQTIGFARAKLARKLGQKSADVATLVRAAYAVTRDC